MKKLNPLKLLIGWLILMGFLTPIFTFILSTGTSGGEQMQFASISTLILVTLIGATFIGLFTPLFYKTWLASNKWFIALSILLLIPTVIVLWQYYFESQYNSIEKNLEINGNKIESKTEYYDNEKKIIRSEKFWKNGKKDSTWTIFSKEGEILSQKIYSNDILLEKN